jgi:hypothetical protein
MASAAALHPKTEPALGSRQPAAALSWIPYSYVAHARRLCIPCLAASARGECPLDNPTYL